MNGFSQSGLPRFLTKIFTLLTQSRTFMVNNICTVLEITELSVFYKLEVGYILMLHTPIHFLFMKG